MLREASSFLRAKLNGKCELRGQDNVQGEMVVIAFIMLQIIEFIMFQIFSATPKNL